MKEASKSERITTISRDTDSSEAKRTETDQAKKSAG